MTIGYDPTKASLIGLLGLFGEAGEVIGAYLKRFGAQEADQGSLLWDLKDAVMAAEKIDALKKRLRSEDHPTIKLPVSIYGPLYNAEQMWLFDEEIADTLYYLNLLAYGRGKTLEEYAQMSLDKVRARSTKSH